MNNEVLELKSCLEKSDFEKETLKRQLKDAFEEKERSQRRLEAVSASNESRLTEMHCVIVELNKKLKAQQDHAIMEEQEPDGSGTNTFFNKIYLTLCLHILLSFRIKLSRRFYLQFRNGGNELRSRKI